MKINVFVRMASAAWLVSASAAQGAAPEWISSEFSKGWDIPGKSAEDFLNKECRPSGLDGIQMLAVQNGHGSTYNLHIYCRKDGANARYKAGMVTFPKGKLGQGTSQLIGRPNVLMGPFHFGDEGQDDGIFYLEKVR